MHRILVLISTLLFTLGPVYAIDFYQGMLEKQDEQYLFFPCGHKSTPMKITFVNDAQTDNINSTLKLLDTHKRVQVSATADVQLNDDKIPYEYTIHIVVFHHAIVDTSCHLTDYLEGLFSNN